MVYLLYKKGGDALYYEPYKKRGKRRRRRGGFERAILKLIIFLVVIAVAACAALYFLPVSMFMVDPEADLAVNTSLPSSPFNVLILGVDKLNDGRQRSDTMIIASIDSGGVKLTSIQRDLKVPIDGHKANKINAAFAFGGAELAMKTVNQVFDMNITKYVVVDFTSVVSLVDAIGGVDVDVTEQEMNHINKNVVDSYDVFGPLGYTATELKTYGPGTHLDGLQALGYARIRKVDSDFGRTSRQRTVINLMIQKLKSNLWNPILVTKFLSAGFEGIDTNLNTAEMISLGEKAVFGGSFDTFRLPMDGTYGDDGSSLTMRNEEKNLTGLRNFIYGN